MNLRTKRQDSSGLAGLPSQVNAPPVGATTLSRGDASPYTTTSTSFILSTQIASDGRPLNIWTLGVVTATLTLSGPPPLQTATSPTSTFPSSTTNSSPTPAGTAPPTSTSSPSSQGTPLSTLIPAIVVPIVVVALVAPIVLYFCLTRHDRQRSRSRMSSRVTSKAYPDSRQEIRSSAFREYSSETQNSKLSDLNNLKASEIMNFDLTPAVEKPLPVVRVTNAPDNAYDRPRRPERPEHSETYEVHPGLDPLIGQAVSRYSIGQESVSNYGPESRVSMQELTEENMRIARLATDSKMSFVGKDQDAVSDVSSPEERTSRHIGRRGLDELSDVSSMYEDDRSPRTDHGGAILGNLEARRSGPLR